jgi:glycine/D-amino acid oxidase-like deaminating enzyme
LIAIAAASRGQHSIGLRKAVYPRRGLQTSMQIGVLGGGLQGCCIALALAERAKVTLYDRNDTLLSRAAVANEGKIHLGYMYAGDPSLATAKTMMTGALAFAPFLERQLGEPVRNFTVSAPANYVVHRDSQYSAEAVFGYLAKVHTLINEHARGRQDDYFGMDLRPPLRPWSAAERAAAFDPTIALAAFDTPEVAIDPTHLAKSLRQCIAANPRIEVRYNSVVVGAEATRSGVVVVSEGAAGPARDRFDHVVNALWDGRLGINATFGLGPGRHWLHRLKYGVSFRLPEGMKAPPSATFVLGPFGEVVSYGDGLTYLTWYPVCMRAISTDVTPPIWDTYPPEPLRSRILAETLDALSQIMPSLRTLEADRLPDACVKGGAIVAWGETDIYDPASELHRRYEIGVTSKGNFHSVDPGKLTMAPYFAEICAQRICQAPRAAGFSG